MCSSFGFAFVVGDFTLQSQLISDNKCQKAKDLHSSGGNPTWPLTVTENSNGKSSSFSEVARETVTLVEQVHNNNGECESKE